MRIALIQPAMGHRGTDFVRSWQMEPLGLATLAALTPKEHSVVLYDDRQQPIPFDEPVDLAAISVETYTARRAYQIARRFRERGTKVVLGGLHPTILPDEAQAHADAVLVGEAEGIWARIVSDAAQGRLEPRYLWRPEPGAPLQVSPDRTLFEGRKYMPLSLVETGRGCRFTCDFCSVAAVAQSTWRAKPVESVVREVEQARHRAFFLVDDNFSADLERSKALLRALIPLNIRWASQASLHVADDPEMLELLQRSGCVMLLVGFESLDPESLRAMNKRFNRGQERYREAIGKLRDHGIGIYGTFVFGYDTDPPDIFERTYEFARAEKLSVAAFNHLQPFPGTPLYRRLEEEGRLLYRAWWLEPGNQFGRIVFRPKSMEPDALRERLRELRRRFYSYPSIVSRALAMPHPLVNRTALAAHFSVNLTLRRELDEKWAVPLGDVSDPFPEVSSASVAA